MSLKQFSVALLACLALCLGLLRLKHVAAPTQTANPTSKTVKPVHSRTMLSNKKEMSGLSISGLQPGDSISALKSSVEAHGCRLTLPRDRSEFPQVLLPSGECLLIFEPAKTDSNVIDYIATANSSVELNGAILFYPGDTMYAAEPKLKGLELSVEVSTFRAGYGQYEIIGSLSNPQVGGVTHSKLGWITLRRRSKLGPI